MFSWFKNKFCFSIPSDVHVFISNFINVSAVANVAYCFDNFANYSLGSSIWGAGVSYGYNSVAGPLKFQLFWSSVTRRVGFYLSLGYSF